MKHFKKLSFIFLAILTCLTLFACGSEKEAKIEEIEGDPNCAHEWSETLDSTKTPCTKENKVYHTCTLCGKLEILRTVPPHGHMYSNERNRCSICNQKTKFGCLHGTCAWTVIEAPTCTTSGTQNSICQKCFFVQDTEFLSSLGHTYVNHDLKDATCTENGHRPYSECSVCDYTTFEVIPAFGHTFVAGTCRTCETKDDTFELLENPNLTVNEFEVKMGTASSLDGKAASITQQSGSITYKDQINSYDFTATVTGKIRVWLTEVYSGTSFRLLVQDDLNATIKSASNVENNEGITVDVTAGKTYKINVSEYYGTGTYVLNIADQKETVDISEYTTVNDKIEYKDQRIVYTYTPKVSGTYRFDMNEIVSSSVVSIRIFNRLNETVKSNTYCGNRDGVTANLEANETYTITVEQNVEMCNYTMSIGIPHDAVDVSEYTSVKDKITFADQTNIYKFTPKTTGKHNFMINDLNGSSVVYLILYNKLDEKLTSDSYCETGDSITYELTAGETYTVAVKYYTGASDYVLKITPARTPLALTSNKGYKETFSYNDQVLTYTFTPSSSDVLFAISELSDEEGYARITVETASGEKILSNKSLKIKDFARVHGLTEGIEYKITLTQYSKLFSFTFSAQPATSEN